MRIPLRHSSNEITSGILHLVGAVGAIVILVLLVIFSAIYGSLWHVVGFTIYGSFMITLYLISTIYHLIPHRKERTKEILQRIDHACVYLFIAATYTPVCLIVLPQLIGLYVLGLLWVLAAIGVYIKLARIKTHYSVPLFLYLVMGWMIILFLPTLREKMSTPTLSLLITGGIAYTLGVVFFVLESKLPQRKYFWMHEIFHVFVLLGSILHTIMMFFLL